MTATNRFDLTGIERVKFAVQDPENARKFASDWGLTETSASGDHFVFEAVDGSEVEIVKADMDDPSRTPVGNNNGVVEVVWGVSTHKGLRELQRELGKDRAADFDDNGVLHSVDDLGIGTGFRIAQRRPPLAEPTRYNAPGRADRINQRAKRYTQARPQEISHIAIGVDNAGEASRFYQERLGFIVSDRYADRGVFMRCSPAGNHHHLFLMNGKAPGTRFNHLAFKVRDVHEVIGGGQGLDAKGWKTFAGPGRHIVSSANFWYFVSPFGGSWEYAADEDMVTEDWESQDFAATAHIFSEWTFGLEKSDGTLRGPISLSKEGKL